MPNNKKYIFSVSKQNKRVEDILKDIPNKSEYICQAILEKADAKNFNKGKIDRSEIKKIVLEVLEELKQNNKIKEEKTVKTEKKEKAEDTNNDNSEDKSFMKNIVKDWGYN